MAANGVEIVKADFDDKQSLFPAFEGATVIFSNTDFFAHLWSAPPERTPNEYAFGRELAQGISIAEAAASPAVLKTLERFVLSSLSDARKLSSGKYTTVYHYDSKADMIEFIRTRLPELAARMSMVQLGHYVTNWKAFPSMAPQKQPDGSYLITRPLDPTFTIPFVVAHRDTGPLVKALVDAPPGKHLLGVSQNMSFSEWTALWGSVLGVKAGFKQVSTDEFFKNVPEWLKKELVDSYGYMVEFGFTGGDPDVLTPDQVSLRYALQEWFSY